MYEQKQPTVFSSAKELPLPLAFLVFAFLAFGQLAQAKDSGDTFRVETDVFKNRAEKPVIHTLTLFAGGLVYDFQIKGESEQMTLFDLPRNRFILLDPERKMKTVVRTQQVLQSCARIKTLVTTDRPLLYFSANPELTPSFDEASGWLTMSSEAVTYRVRGSKPRYGSSVRRYQDFADWSARLNSMLGVGLPPQMRVEVDTEIARKGWIPEEVERSIPATGSLLGKSHIARTRHQVNWKLSQTDRKRIERVGGYLASFREVELFEFRSSSSASK